MRLLCNVDTTLAGQQLRVDDVDILIEPILQQSRCERCRDQPRTATRHLAAFLKRQSGAAGGPPAAILFNGGVFQPASLRELLVQVMHGWYDRPAHVWKPLVLTNPSLDLAVAWGAAAFAWLRHPRAAVEIGRVVADAMGAPPFTATMRNFLRVRTGECRLEEAAR